MPTLYQINWDISMYPERSFGTLRLIRLRIWPAMVSTKATLPSLFWGAPLSSLFRVSTSARQAASKELSAAAPLDVTELIATDWPITATQGISDVFGGPWFNRSARTAASAFESPSAWSILLIIPTVLVPMIN